MPHVHFTPQFFSDRKHGVIELIDVKCDEFDLRLKNGKEIVARRPFPNKGYQVACRKVGKKAIVGLLVECDRIPSEFTVTTRWAVAAEEVLTHTVRYVMMDWEFNFASDRMSLWYPEGGFPSRWPNIPQYDVPAKTQPCMGIIPWKGRQGIILDELGLAGFLQKRHETFYMPTVPERRVEIWNRADCLPARSEAFTAPVREQLQIQDNPF